jgi:hypothetical protein
MTAIASLIIANQAKAQIGWTLDQCKAKYGEAVKDDGQDQSVGIQTMRGYASITPAGEMYIFNVSGFKLGIAFAYDVVLAIDYEPDVPLTFEQAKKILIKNANTAWRKDAQLRDEEADTFIAKSKHELVADVYLDNRKAFYDGKDSPPDHNSIRCIVIVDDTVHTQINKESEALDKENKAKKEQKTRDDVNGL